MVLGIGELTRDVAAQTCAAPLPISCNQTKNKQNTANPPPLGTIDCTNDRQNYSCGAGTWSGGDQVWQFTPPAGQEVYVDVHQLFQSTFGVTTNLDLWVETGNCGAGTCEFTSQNTNLADEHLNWIADGSTYYLWVDRKSSAFSSCIYDYQIKTGCPEPCDPITDVAEDLSCSSDLLGETTVGGTDVLDYYACGTPFSNINQRNPKGSTGSSRTTRGRSRSNRQHVDRPRHLRPRGGL